jgi:L-ribulose-5-phosphate 3-epimerase
VNEIGIMQGRLSPPSSARLQAFPWASWQQEFQHAAACGFDAIEWLFEDEGFDRNPVWTDAGVEQIGAEIATTGTPLRSLCGDYFMQHPFFRVSDAEAVHSVAVLERLIAQASRLSLRTILLPVLEIAELRTRDEQAQLLERLRGPLDLAARLDVRIGLETELPAAEYRDLVETADHPALGAYFDTGNAAAKGYDIARDVRVLGPLLCGVHVKDRKKDGPSVPLGQGDADFPGFFAALAEVGYTGPLVLQAAFGPDFLGMAGSHLAFVRSLL